MRYFSTATALTVCALGAPAMADVTPAQVWEDFSTYLEEFGYTIDGQQAETADGLEISGLTVSMDLPEDGTSVSMLAGDLELLDNGDGSVSVILPETVPFEIRFDDGSEAVDMVINMVHQGLDIVVSGTTDELISDYSAESLGLSLGSMAVNGDAVPLDAVRFDMTAAPFEGGSVRLLSDGIRAFAQEGLIGDLSYTIVANDPEGESGAIISGNFADITFEGTSAVPEGMDLTDMQAALAAGLSGDGLLRHEGGSVEFSVTEDGATTSGQTSSGGGYLTVSLLDEALGYGIGGIDASISVSAPDLPFPVSASFDESRFDILVPLGEPGEMQEASIGLTLAGLTVSELLWNIFDPGAALPRDPATLVLDLSAMVTPFVSVFDPEAMEALGDEVPGELNEVTLEGLELSVAGGSIIGTGAMTFDNTDLETFDGLPRPEGQVDLEVSGLNGLIDSLIAMGLVAESDAMGARMMLSMFTVPGAEPDTATSRLEITPEGQILANGQRIR